MVFFSSVHGGQKHYENISEREMQEKNIFSFLRLKLRFYIFSVPNERYNRRVYVKFIN